MVKESMRCLITWSKRSISNKKRKRERLMIWRLFHRVRISIKMIWIVIGARWRSTRKQWIILASRLVARTLKILKILLLSVYNPEKIYLRKFKGGIDVVEQPLHFYYFISLSFILIFNFIPIQIIDLLNFELSII